MARICPLLLRMLAVLLAFLPAGCKDEIPELIPSTRVRIVIDLALPEFSGLRFPGSVYLAKGEGYRGNGVYVVREATRSSSQPTMPPVPAISKPPRLQCLRVRRPRVPTATPSTSC